MALAHTYVKMIRPAAPDFEIDNKNYDDDDDDRHIGILLKRKWHQANCSDLIKGYTTTFNKFFNRHWNQVAYERIRDCCRPNWRQVTRISRHGSIIKQQPCQKLILVYALIQLSLKMPGDAFTCTIIGNSVRENRRQEFPSNKNEFMWYNIKYMFHVFDLLFGRVIAFILISAPQPGSIVPSASLIFHFWPGYCTSASYHRTMS